MRVEWMLTQLKEYSARFVERGTWKTDFILDHIFHHLELDKPSAALAVYYLLICSRDTTTDPPLPVVYLLALTAKDQDGQYINASA